MQEPGAGAPDSPSQISSTPSRLRLWWQRFGWMLRWGGTLIGVLYVMRLIDMASLRSAFSHASAWTLVAALAVVAAGQVLGAARWRILLAAYGAVALPRLSQAVRLYFIAVFYNTYLPGGVAGDIVRGVVTRDAFAGSGATEALAVVLVERALGLLGVFALVAVGLALVGSALADTGALWVWSAAGGAGAVALVLALPLARSVARFLPGRLAAVARRLPVVSLPLQFALAVVLSLGTQLAVAVCGFLLLRDFHPATTFADALFIVPLAAATIYLPITVGGTGAREAVFITLCGKVLGMPSHDALAASLLLWFTSLVAGAVGGVLQLLSRHQTSPASAAAPALAPPATDAGQRPH